MTAQEPAQPGQELSLTKLKDLLPTWDDPDGAMFSRLIHTQLRMGLQNISNQEFEELGRAWFAENLRRNPLPTEDDVHVAYHMANFRECECFKQCACTGDVCNDCCPGCAADEECQKCDGWGMVADPNCQNCRGCGHRSLMIDIDKLQGQERHDFLEKISTQEQKNYQEMRIASSNFGDRWNDDEVFTFYEKVIAQLGGKLIHHPVMEWGENVAVMMPKYPSLAVAQEEKPKPVETS